MFIGIKDDKQKMQYTLFVVRNIVNYKKITNNPTKVQYFKYGQ